MKYTFRYFLFALLLSACGDKVEIENSQAETFNKLYGNAGNDSGCEIRELPDGNFLILATIETLDPQRLTDIALIKTDQFGNEIWRDTYGREGEDQAGGMDIGQNGNIIIGGTSYNVGTTEEDTNHSDIIVIELNSDLQVINERVFSQFLDNEVCNTILYDNSNIGGYIIGGSTDKADSTGLATQSRSPTANDKFVKDFLTVRVFQEGGNEVVDDFNAGFESDDEIKSCVLSGDEFDNILFTGYTVENGIQKPIILNIRNKNDGIPINNFRELELGSNSTGNKIIRIDDGYSILGTSKSLQAYFIQELGNNKLLKGNPFEYQKNGNLMANDFIFDSNTKNYIVAGTTNDTDLSKGGGFDHYIASIKQDGKINWEKTYGGTGDEEAFALAPTKDGGFIITGYTGFEGNSLINTIKVDNKGILNP